VTASFHGDEPVIAFNPHYLLDGLTAAAVGAASPAEAAAPAGAAAPEEATARAEAPAIRLEFTSPAKPALITLAGTPGNAADEAAPKPAFRYLVVPLRSPTRA
jgi:DNA polymerase III sliding clamp (beta) subunit (PCNA family)